MTGFVQIIHKLSPTILLIWITSASKGEIIIFLGIVHALGLF